MCGQAASLSHTHEHLDEEAPHNSCQFCITASHNEDVLEQDIDTPDLTDDTPKTDMTVHHQSCDVSGELQKTASAHQFFALSTQIQPLAPKRALDAARAPPVH